MSSTPKKEGAKQTCSCGTLLECHLKEYPGFPAKLQWQNSDGSPHYKFAGTKIIDGKKVTQLNCKKPEKKEEIKPTVEPSENVDLNRIVTIEKLDARVETLTGICQTCLTIVAELKLALISDDGKLKQ